MNNSPIHAATRRTRTLVAWALAAALSLAAITTASATFIPRSRVAAPRAEAAEAAFVTTDQTDYKPGETVVITGSGWAAGETVKLVIHVESSARADAELSAEADEYGNILNKEFTTKQEDLGASFTLTATGQSSGRTAESKFTDGGIMNYSPNGVALSAFSGAAGSTPAGFTQTVTAPSGNGNFQAPASVTSVSVSGSIAMPVSWVSVSGGTGNFATGPANNPKSPPDFKLRSVTVTPAPNTAPGTYSAIVSSVPAANSGVGAGQGTVIQLTVTADNGAPTTTLSAVDSNNNPYGGVNFTNANKVTIKLSATDAGGSGVQVTRYKIDNAPFQNYTGPFDIGGQGLSVVTYFSVDNTGTQETSKTFTVKIDKTAPVVSCGSAGSSWQNADVSIPCTAVDGGGQQKSGLANASDAGFSLSTNVPAGTADSNAHTGQRQVCDNAGNCATAGPITGNMIDKELPAVTAGATAGGNPYNAGDWTNQNVTVTFQCSDGSGSGVASVDGPETLTAEGANQSSTGQCSDVAGNTAQVMFTPINIDKTAPTITALRTPAPNANGWNKTDVTVSVDSASDDLSGVASSSAPVTLTTEGANQSVTLSATDNAGNTASTTVSGINIDKTAPAIGASRSPAANANGWNNTGVTASASASDALSGVDAAASTLGDVLFSAEGAGQSATFTVFDLAGNSASAAVSDVNIDKTKPTLSFDSYSPAANGAGWNNTDVSVAYTANDALSGVDTSTPSNPVVLSAEGSSVTGSVTVTDKAGNGETFTTSPVKIDKTKPSLAPARRAGSEANGAGWNNSDVTVDANASDGLSGVASVSPGASRTVSSEGANQSVSFTATDAAGNSETASLGGINIDKTAPAVTAKRNPLANSFGWNNTDVTVSVDTATDALSGVASTSAPVVVGTGGSNQSATVSATDLAGNTGSATVGNINIDKTAPSVTISSPGAGPYMLNQPVAASYNCSDGGNPPSGTDACAGTVAVGGNVNTSSVGPHTFSVSASDKAGNTANKSVTYGVVYDWSGFLQPINNDGSSVFKLGSTVPVKFRLVGGSAGVTNATNFTLWVAKVSNNVIGSEIEAVTSTPASTGNLFRYDPSGGIYIYNMGTKGAPWTAGTWQLRVDLGDGAPPRTVLISLKP